MVLINKQVQPAGKTQQVVCVTKNKFLHEHLSQKGGGKFVFLLLFVPFSVSKWWHEPWRERVRRLQPGRLLTANERLTGGGVAALSRANRGSGRPDRPPAPPAGQTDTCPAEGTPNSLPLQPG